MTIRPIATASIPVCRVTHVEYIRLRALERLYARRDALDDLIRSLQDYDAASTARRAQCIPISVGRRCL